jgi:DNA-binding MarR family transcriptional regulator
MRVLDISDTLGWEKSRVSHLLTRMERRDLVARNETGTPGRRTGISLTPQGRRLADIAVDRHAESIRQFFFDAVSSDEAAAIQAWSVRMIRWANDRHYNDADGATGA